MQQVGDDRIVSRAGGNSIADQELVIPDAGRGPTLLVAGLSARAGAAQPRVISIEQVANERLPFRARKCEMPRGIGRVPDQYVIPGECDLYARGRIASPTLTPNETICVAHRAPPPSASW